MPAPESPPNYRELHVAFPSWPGWDIRHLTMARISADSSTDFDLSGYADACDCRLSTKPIPHVPRADHTLSVKVDSASHDDYNSDSPVFHATTPAPGTTALALKFALREDLIPALLHEAHMYNVHLLQVQGRVVPWCWGLFVGISNVTGERVACLVLEYWGEALPVRFAELHKDLRMYILNQLKEIHRCGVHHGDFAERNILYTESNGVDIRIIDFDQTMPHICKGNCDLLRQAGIEMEM